MKRFITQFIERNKQLFFANKALQRTLLRISIVFLSLSSLDVSAQTTVVGSNTATGTNSVTIARPTGLQVGDLMIVNLQYTPNNNITYPSGWTERINYEGGSGSARTRIAYKVAVLADVTTPSYIFSVASGTRIAGGISAFRGVNTAANGGIEIIGTPVGANNSTITIQPPQITTTEANTMVLFFSQLRLQDLSFNTNWRLGGASGTLMNQLYVQNAPNVTDGCGVSGAYYIQPAAGATGAGYQTTATGSGRRAGILMALTPFVCGSGSDDLAPVADAEIWTSQTGLNYGTCATLYVNRSPQQRAFIRHNVAGIPANAIITSAVLRLTKFGGNNTAHNLSVHRVTRSWTEGSGGCSGASGGVTWINSETGTPWTLAGGDFVAAAAATTSVGGDGQYEWDITSLVQDWVSGVHSNDGVVLKFATEGGSSQEKNFRSREFGTSADVPRLIISYTIPYSATVTKTNITCAGNTDGIIQITNPTGGSGSFEYRLDNGNWQSGSSFNGLAAGTYSVQLRDALNQFCVTTLGDQTITAPSVLTANVSSTDITCNGASNGTITISSPSGGNGAPYQFLHPITLVWGASSTFTGLPPGSYEVNMRNGSEPRCSTLLTTVNISQPATLNASIDITQPTCFANGDVSITPTGGTGPYSYNWTDLAGSNNPQNRFGLAPNTYQVTVTDANGCTWSSGNIVLAAPINCAGIVACTNDNSELYLTTPNPDISSYTWSFNRTSGATGGNDPIIITGQGTSVINVDWNNTNPGSFELCVTAENVCGTSEETCQDIDVVEPAASATANLACEGGNLELFASGGVSYAWSGPNGFLSSSANPVIQGATAAANNGTYTVTVTNSQGCIAQASVNVTVQSAPALSASITNTTCGNSTGAINLTVTPSGTYTYAWSNSASTEDISGIAAGNYTVTVTNAAGCSAVQTFSVGNSNGPSVAAVTAVNVACNGGNTGSITITSITGGTSPYSYSWSGPNGFVATSQSISNLSAGTYNLVITATGGCQGFYSRTITEPELINIDFVKTDVNCFGQNNGTINLIVGGGTGSYNYSWSTIGGSGLVAGASSQNNLTAGSYTVIVSDGNNCSASRTIEITQPAALLAVNPTVTHVACFGESTGQVVLSVSGGTGPYTYAWSATAPATVPSGQQNNQNLTALAAGTYSVIVTDNRGCTFTLPAIVVNQASSPLAVTGTPTPVTCFGNANGGVILNDPTGGTPPFSYLWSNGSMTKNLSNVAVGTYTVVVTDVLNCATSTSFNVNQPALLVASVTNTQDVTCNNGTNGAITLSVVGGNGTNTFLWTSVNGEIPAGQEIVQNPTGLTAGTYTVLVSDVNGCNATTSTTINQPTAILASALLTDVTCNNGNNGAILLNVSGGSGAGYTYAWTTLDGTGLNATSQNQSGLTAGTYTVVVTDGASCTSIAYDYILDGPVPIGITMLNSNLSCAGGTNDGSIDLTITGGVAPFSFAWTTANGSIPAGQEALQNITGLGIGTYSVTVTDFNGCTASLTSAPIVVPDALVASTTVLNDVICYQTNTGAALAVVSGGTPPYQYIWGNGETNVQADSLEAGLTSLTVLDAQGCSVTTSVNIEESEGQFSLFGDIKNVSSCGANTGAVINVAPEFNNGTVSYEWEGPNGFFSSSEDIIGLAPGTYTVVATDSEGCTTTNTFDVQISPAIGLTVSTFSTSCSLNDGQAYPIITGGVSPFSYVWSNGSTAAFVSNLATGAHSVTVTDADGCTAFASFTIGSPTNCITPVTTPDVFNATCGILEGNVSTNDGNTPVSDFEYYAGGQASPEQGVLVWGFTFDGSFTFVPTTGFVGTVVIPYSVSHLPSGLAETGTLTINVAPCLTLPDVNATFINVIVAGDVATNDVLPLGSTYGTSMGTTIVKVSSPAGSIDVLQVASSGSYTFEADVVGVYVYDVEVCSPTQTSPDCKTERLTISVLGTIVGQNPPVTAPDFGLMTGNFGNLPVNTIELNLRINDLVGNAGGVLGTPIIVSQPLNGTVAIMSGNLVYQPNEGFYGQEYMEYEVCESPSGLCRTEQVYITVLGADADITVVGIDDYAYTTTGQTITVSNAALGMLANDYSTAASPALTGNIIGGTATANPGETERIVAGVGKLTMQEDGRYVFVPLPAFSGTAVFPYEVCDGAVCAKATLYILVESTIIRVFPKVLLEGPRIVGTSTMTTALSAGGSTSILATYALTQPYGTAPWPTVKQYQGTETVAASFFTTHTDIVDWVLIELRSKTNSANIVYRRAGLLKADGTIIDVDGLPGLICEGLTADDYYIAVRHRNHLGVMGANTVLLDADPVGNVIDFTTTTTALYGTNAAQVVSAGVQALHMGNANPDSEISFTGTANDKARIGIKVNSIVNINNKVLGYTYEDLDLNGEAAFTGSGNDKAKLGIKLVTTTNVNNKISEQLP